MRLNNLNESRIQKYYTNIGKLSDELNAATQSLTGEFLSQERLNSIDKILEQLDAYDSSLMTIYEVSDSFPDFLTSVQRIYDGELPENYLEDDKLNKCLTLMSEVGNVIFNTSEDLSLAVDNLRQKLKEYKSNTPKSLDFKTNKIDNEGTMTDINEALASADTQEMWENAIVMAHDDIDKALAQLRNTADEKEVRKLTKVIEKANKTIQKYEDKFAKQRAAERAKEEKEAAKNIETESCCKGKQCKNEGLELTLKDNRLSDKSGISIRYNMNESYQANVDRLIERIHKFNGD